MNATRKGFTFTWILENFEYCEQRREDSLNSPTFIVETIERSKWSLEIQPRRTRSGSWIGLFLYREGDSKGPAFIDVEYELAIQTQDGLVLAPEGIRRFVFAKFMKHGSPLFLSRESVFAKKSTFLPQGALTIWCRMSKRNGEVNMNGQCVARTRIGVERKAFFWKIRNFSSFYEGQEANFRLKSTSDDKQLVSLKLFLRVSPNSNGIIIKFYNFDLSTVYFTFKSSAIVLNNVDVDCGQHEFWLSSSVQSKECLLSLSRDTLMRYDFLYLPYDVLTLYCELAFSTGTVLQEIEGTVYGCSNSFITNNLIPANVNTADVKKSDSETSHLKMDLNSMLQNNILSDVKLCAESETFSAHWFILSARSPVFRAMFQSGMKEKVQDRIDIEDLKPDTVRRMLLYMYTDSLEELQWETASDLYVAAEKYQIMALKDKCSSFLKSNLSLSNACKILLLSDLLQDKELKSTVQDFILKNDDSVINSNYWIFLMEDNVSLAAETMLLRYKKK